MKKIIAIVVNGLLPNDRHFDFIMSPTTLLSIHELHNLRRRPVPAQQINHDAHRLVDVMEEFLVSGEKVIQSFHPVRSSAKAVLQAIFMASKKHIAFPAIVGQLFTLIQPELPLVGGGCQVIN